MEKFESTIVAYLINGLGFYILISDEEEEVQNLVLKVLDHSG